MLSELPVSAYAVATAPNELANSSRVAPSTLGHSTGNATWRQY